MSAPSAIEAQLRRARAPSWAPSRAPSRGRPRRRGQIGARCQPRRRLRRGRRRRGSRRPMLGCKRSSSRSNWQRDGYKASWRAHSNATRSSRPSCRAGAIELELVAIPSYCSVRSPPPHPSCSATSTTRFSKYVDEPPKTALPPRRRLRWHPATAPETAPATAPPSSPSSLTSLPAEASGASDAVAGAYGAASGSSSGSTSSSTEASHGHGRAVVGSSTEAPRSSAAMWASAGYFASTPTTAPTSHGHWRAVVGNSSRSGGGVSSSSSTHGGQARHAPLWARHGTLSATLLLFKDAEFAPRMDLPSRMDLPRRCRARTRAMLGFRFVIINIDHSP
jgi:hypothetical protein